MYGAISGDIIGSAYEYNGNKDPLAPLFTEKSAFTDDTIMSCAVMQWLQGDTSETELERIITELTERHPDKDYGTDFTDWLFEPEHIRDRRRRHLFSFLSRKWRYSNPATGRRAYYSCGNGAAMRAWPIGFHFAGEYSRFNLAWVKTTAAKAASISHDHPEGIKGACATATAVYMAACGLHPEDIINHIETNYGYKLMDIILKMDNDMDGFRNGFEYSETCQDTVPTALAIGLTADTFEHAMQECISLGGDADTIACIAGAVCDARGLEDSFIRNRTIELLPDDLLETIRTFNASVRTNMHHYAPHWIRNEFKMTLGRTGDMIHGLKTDNHWMQAVRDIGLFIRDFSPDNPKRELEYCLNQFRHYYPEKEAEALSEILTTFVRYNLPVTALIDICDRLHHCNDDDTYLIYSLHNYMTNIYSK